MSNIQYRYKQLAQHKGKLKVKAWHSPIRVIRKVSDMTCEGCFFDRTVNQINMCKAMIKSNQLPSCNTGKRQYIFKKVIPNEKLKKTKDNNNTQEHSNA
jgi:hypothetical protein